MIKNYQNKQWLYKEYIEKQRSLKNIAEEFDITHSAIYYWLKKYGFNVRTCKEAGTLLRRSKPIKIGKYQAVYKPEHPNSYPTTGYILIHRLKASEKIGRPLKSNEIVHHIDFDKTNNSMYNLDIISNKQHFSATQSLIKIGLEWAIKEFKKGNIMYDKNNKQYIILP